MRFPGRFVATLTLALLTVPTIAFGAKDGRDAPSRADRRARLRADIVVPRDVPTIQAAIDLAEDGGSIFVLPGEYREALTILGKRIRLSGGGRAKLVGESSRIVDSPERAIGLVTYLEGGGGVFEGFALHGGLNGLVGQPPADPGGGEVPVPVAQAHALTIRDVQIRNTGRGILWRAPADLTVEDTQITDVHHHGVVFRPKLGSEAHIMAVNVALNTVGHFGILVMDTPSVGCQNQLVSPGSLGAQDGGIGVFRSGVCIFGGVLLANHKAGIYLQQSGAIVDGTQILETIGPDAAGIMAVGSVLHKVVNAELASPSGSSSSAAPRSSGGTR